MILIGVREIAQGRFVFTCDESGISIEQARTDGKVMADLEELVRRVYRLRAEHGR